MRTGIESDSKATASMALFLSELRGMATLDDEHLADVIEERGQALLDAGEMVRLEDLLSAVDGLARRRVSLDAAIDLAVRALRKTGLSKSDAAQRLMAAHPGLAPAIRLTVAIDAALGNTSSLAGAGSSQPISLPAEFGPAMADGRARFDLRERLGGGSQGDVYLAADRLMSASGKPAMVAIKMLHESTNAVQSAAGEAVRARRVRHRGVASVFDRGAHQGREYIVYEYIDGRSLDLWLADQPGLLAPRKAAALVAEMAEAVQAAHAMGVIHRDLKPSNVLVDRDGHPHVTDFGLAAEVEAVEAHAGGSLAFSSPEQLRGERGSWDTRTDVYALGGLLYWLLTRRFPNGETRGEIERSMREQSDQLRAPDPRASVGNLSATLTAICRRAMDPDPARRYQSAEAFASDLRAWLASEPVVGVDRGLIRRTTLLFRRSPVTAIGLSLGALAVLAGAILAVRANAEGRRVKIESELAAAKSRQQSLEQRIQLARGLISAYNQTIRLTQADERSVEWLPSLTVIESVSGPRLLNAGKADVDLQTARLSAVDSRLLELAANGQADSVEYLLWETAKGFWLVSADRHAEARPVLDANIDRCRRVFASPSEPWLQFAMVLRDLCVARSPESGEDEQSAAQRRIDALPLDSLPEPLQDLISPPRPEP